MNSPFGLSHGEVALLRHILESMGGALEKVAVFGSRAEGNHKRYSDLDLVI